MKPFRRSPNMARLTERAFSQFYGEMWRPLRRYVYRMTRHTADTDDIVQDAFCRIWRSDVGSLSTTDLKHYMFCAARHLVTDRWRRATRERLWRLQARSDTIVKPAEPHDDVTKTFATLDPRERALLWLAYVEEESHHDIAGALRVGRGSVKVLLSRARANLRDRLVAQDR